MSPFAFPPRACRPRRPPFVAPMLTSAAASSSDQIDSIPRPDVADAGRGDVHRRLQPTLVIRATQRPPAVRRGHPPGRRRAGRGRGRRPGRGWGGGRRDGGGEGEDGRGGGGGRGRWGGGGPGGDRSAPVRPPPPRTGSAVYKLSRSG